MEMNSRDKSALLLCGGTLMWTPEVSEDVGLCSPQNFVPESVPVCIILPDIDGLRIKVVGFLVPCTQDLGNIILLYPLK